MISICVLNWNCSRTLRQIIKAIHQIKDVEYEILIYDQNSNDGSKDFLEKIKCDNIKVILSDKNTGSSISRNCMIRMAKYKYVLLLDSDIIPIKNSIENMVYFMENNPDFVFLGYDYNRYSNIWKETTQEEIKIENYQVDVWPHHIALTQYGIFKKSILEKYPFPEFYPFNGPGWGGEDDIVGNAIFSAKEGKAGTIRGRIYFHNKGSSLPNLGQDYYLRNYIIRFNYLMYFLKLSVDKKIDSLINKKLPTTKLRCNTYHWGIQNNLGDIATDILLKEHFPFLEFDKTEKNNLLMFGGTIFNHIENANNIHKANFKNILYYGVGVSNEWEINHALEIIKNNKIEFQIFPRGYETQRQLIVKGIEPEQPVGDVLQLCSSMPTIETNENDPELLVLDIWKPNLINPKSNNFKTIKVANDNKSFLDIEFCDYYKFLNILKNYSKVYSSQIHPILLSSLLGKPCNIYQKDWRVDDFKYFSAFKLDMNKEDCLKLREQAQKNIQKFSYNFFKNIERFM